MTFYVNTGASMNLMRQPPPQLNGFAARFMLGQDDVRRTPGKSGIRLPSETTNGATKSKKSNRKTVKVNDQKLTGMPLAKTEAIYNGFANVKPVQSKPKAPKRKRKRRRKRVKG